MEITLKLSDLQKKIIPKQRVRNTYRLYFATIQNITLRVIYWKDMLGCNNSLSCGREDFRRLKEAHT
ncbi:MAG: hypothetical protein KAK00_03085 [Nanoarchaeota archaeon]|nr:hypothetical protein [Nanoarchaeota archaeon]